MDKSVVIKSNRHGLILNLDAEKPFSELKETIRGRFSESSKFFGDVKMALTIEGRTLNSSEISEVVDIINDTTDVEILAVIDSPEENDKIFKKELSKVFNELDAYAAEIYPLNVEDGMNLEFKRSVIIMGHVSKEAEIHTDGSVFVLGRLEGRVYAGELGNTSAKVYANRLLSENVYIADVPYAPDKPNGAKEEKRLFKRKRDKSYASKNIPVLLSLADGKVQAERTEEFTEEK